MDNTIKLVSIIAGIVGGLAQTFMGARELYKYTTTDQTKENVDNNGTEEAKEV